MILPSAAYVILTPEEGNRLGNPPSIGLRIIKFPVFVSAPCDHSNLKEAQNKELVTEISEDTRTSLAYMQLHTILSQLKVQQSLEDPSHRRLGGGGQVSTSEISQSSWRPVFVYDTMLYSCAQDGVPAVDGFFTPVCPPAGLQPGGYFFYFEGLFTSCLSRFSLPVLSSLTLDFFLSVCCS